MQQQRELLQLRSAIEVAKRGSYQEEEKEDEGQVEQQDGAGVQGVLANLLAKKQELSELLALKASLEKQLLQQEGESDDEDGAEPVARIPASARPSNVDSPGLSVSTSSSSGGHSPSGSKRTTLVVTQRTRPATGGVSSKGVSSFESGPAEKSLPSAMTACEKVSVMASCPANSSLAAPALPGVGVRERTVNGWSRAAVSLAGRFTASAGARTTLVSVSRGPSAGVGGFPVRPVGGPLTVLRAEKRLRDMRPAAKLSTRRSRLDRKSTRLNSSH